MIDNNFATVALAEVFQRGLLPHNTAPAPYIFLVDDEHPLADTLALILRNDGYAVTVAYDAESAIEIAQLAPPQLLVTDIGLPGMNGIEFAFRVQELIPDCKAILITGLPELAAGLLVTRPRHCLPLLAKPIQPAELLKEVSELLVEQASITTDCAKESS